MVIDRDHALLPRSEPLSGGHITAFQKSARGGQHFAVRLGNADPGVVVYMLLQVLDDLARDRRVGMAQLWERRQQVDVAHRLVEGAVERIAHLPRQLLQP